MLYGFIKRFVPWTYSMVFTALKVWNDILGKSNKDLLYCEFSQFTKIIFQRFFSKLKTITELIKPYFVKLQSMGVIKIIHFVFFYQYSVSYFYSVYCISLYVTLFFTISFIYMSFFSFSSSRPFSCSFFFFFFFNFA